MERKPSETILGFLRKSNLESFERGGYELVSLLTSSVLLIYHSQGTTGLGIDHGKDCNNVCNGRARNDSCNACTIPPANDRTGRDSPLADCHGTCFGTAVIDSCGVCSGGETGKRVDYRQDACGQCSLAVISVYNFKRRDVSGVAVVLGG